MTIEEQYSYYSRHFNIICEYENQLQETYKLSVLLNPGPDSTDGPILLDVKEDILEPDLDKALEDLKFQTLLKLDI